MANNKALGQHWLKNRAILEEIAELAARRGALSGDRGGGGVVGSSGDRGKGGAKGLADNRGAEGSASLCVEIGPGLGTLTSSLLRRFDRVIAVEYDKRLADNLPGSFPGTNLEVVNGDILQFDFSKLPRPYVVVGNIPYYITSPIIDKVLEAEPRRAVFLIQKEVAERIASDKESVLALSVKNRAKVELGPVVPASEFTPPPKVDSQVIVLVPHEPIVDEKVIKLIKIGFLAPRKKVIKNLSGVLPREKLEAIFEKSNIDIDARPHELHLADWQKIYDKIAGRV